MAIAKFASDKDYQIFIDMELAGNTKFYAEGNIRNR